MARKLLHQRLVHVQAAGGVQDDRIQHAGLGVAQGLAAHGDGGRGARGTVDLDLHHPAQGHQLVLRRRPLEVGRHQERPLTLAPEEPSQLPGRGGFSGPLQTDQHEHGGWLPGGPQAVGRAAHEGRQLLIDHLDHLLARRERFENVTPHGALTDALEERANDLDVDVRFEQGQTHLAQRLRDVVLAEAAEATQPLEDVVQPVAEPLEHGFPRKT